MLTDVFVECKRRRLERTINRLIGRRFHPNPKFEFFMTNGNVLIRGTVEEKRIPNLESIDDVVKVSLDVSVRAH